MDTITDAGRAVARTYSLSGKLLQDLLKKFVGFMPDGRIHRDDVFHAQFVAEQIRYWARAELLTAGVFDSIDIETDIHHGLAWDNKLGAEIILVFPKRFGKILVEQTVKDYTPEDRYPTNYAGHLDDYQYAEVMRNIVTPEGSDDPGQRQKRKTENDATTDGAD